MRRQNHQVGNTAGKKTTKKKMFFKEVRELREQEAEPRISPTVILPRYKSMNQRNNFKTVNSTFFFNLPPGWRRLATPFVTDTCCFPADSRFSSPSLRPAETFQVIFQKNKRKKLQTNKYTQKVGFFFPLTGVSSGTFALRGVE